MNDLEFMLMVDMASEQSNDRSTHIGAVLLDKTERLVSADANHLPIGIADTDARQARPAKYFYFEHAERNVIYKAARLGIEIRGGTMFTTGVPCADCARAVIQVGLKAIVVWETGSGLERRGAPAPGTMDWGASIEAGEEMLREAGVEIRKVAKT